MGSDRVDKILEVLDDAGQTSTETGYAGHLDDGACWHCTTEPAIDGSSTCAPCRAFLLGDTDVDPRNQKPLPLMLGVSAPLDDYFDAIRDDIRALAAVAEIPTDLVESALTRSIEAEPPLIVFDEVRGFRRPTISGLAWARAHVWVPSSTPESTPSAFEQFLAGEAPDAWLPDAAWDAIVDDA